MNETIERKVKAFIELNEKGEVYKAGGIACRLVGDIAELSLAESFGQNKEYIREVGRIDLFYKGISIDIKVNNSQIATLLENGIIEKVNHGMYYGYIPKFNPLQDIKKQVRFIKLDDFIDFLISNDLIVRNYTAERMRNRALQGERRFYDRLNIRINKLYTSDEVYNSFINYSCSFDEFIEYAKNRESKQDLIDYRKIERTLQKYISNKWNSFYLP